MSSDIFRKEQTGSVQDKVLILLCSHFNGKILIIVRLAMAERVIVKIRRLTVDYAMT